MSLNWLCSGDRRNGWSKGTIVSISDPRCQAVTRLEIPEGRNHGRSSKRATDDKFHYRR